MLTLGTTTLRIGMVIRKITPGLAALRIYIVRPAFGEMVNLQELEHNSDRERDMRLEK
jgi:hypothetical protein